jgi:ferric-dicitrate binding protein FerR (iron transport regulator)
VNDRELEQLARSALDPLARSPLRVASPAEAEQRFARLGGPLEEVIAEAGRQSRVDRRRLPPPRAVWALAAAALVALGIGLGVLGKRWLPPSNGESVRVLQGRMLGVTSDMSAVGVVATPADRGARLLDGQGVELAIAKASRLDLSALRSARRVVLLQGSANFDVPHQREDHTFLVVTRDLDVVVHGTRFRVELLPSSTCVQVSRGLVEVQRKNGERHFLAPGASWGCRAEGGEPVAGGGTLAAPPLPAVTAPRGEPTRALGKREPAPSADAATTARRADKTAGATLETESALAEQVRLLAEGLAAEQKGDDAAARAALRSLIDKYPESSFATEARGLLRRLSDRQTRLSP